MEMCFADGKFCLMLGLQRKYQTNLSLARDLSLFESLTVILKGNDDDDDDDCYTNLIRDPWIKI